MLKCIAAGRMCFSIITVYRGGSKLPVYRSYANKSFSQVSSAVHTIKQDKARLRLTSSKSCRVLRRNHKLSGVQLKLQEVQCQKSERALLHVYTHKDFDLSAVKNNDSF